MLKAFFNKGTIIKCLVFSLFLSLPFMWRLTHLKGISFFSFQAFQVYLTFCAINFIIFLVVFFVLFWMAYKKQQQ
jgi:hypothetical protein